ncbi:MAG: hypothetical protein QM778_38335 [Myxococcales bacterium]
MKVSRSHRQSFLALTTLLALDGGCQFSLDADLVRDGDPSVQNDAGTSPPRCPVGYTCRPRDAGDTSADSTPWWPAQQCEWDLCDLPCSSQEMGTTCANQLLSFRATCDGTKIGCLPLVSGGPCGPDVACNTPCSADPYYACVTEDAYARCIAGLWHCEWKGSPLQDAGDVYDASGTDAGTPWQQQCDLTVCGRTCSKQEEGMECLNAFPALRAQCSNEQIFCSEQDGGISPCITDVTCGDTCYVTSPFACATPDGVAECVGGQVLCSSRGDAGGKDSSSVGFKGGQPDGALTGDASVGFD